MKINNPLWYNELMSEIDEKSMALKEATVEQPESTDPEYIAWVNEKIRQGQEDLKDPAKRYSLDEVLEELDLAD